MSKHYLSKRDNWQAEARKTGDRGEEVFSQALQKLLPDSYTIVKKPYLKIYSKNKGVIPDALIINNKNGKQIYIEKKTGDAGSGNAHERAGKFLSEGIRNKIKELEPNTVDDTMFFVFSGKTFQIPKYQDEINLMFEGHQYAIMDNNFSNIENVATKIENLLR